MFDCGVESIFVLTRNHLPVCLQSHLKSSRKSLSLDERGVSGALRPDLMIRCVLNQAASVDQLKLLKHLTVLLIPPDN